MVDSLEAKKRNRDGGCNIPSSPPRKRIKKPARELAHDAYTAGWVCVLQSELNAARAMLDEEHRRLPHSAVVSLLLSKRDIDANAEDYRKYTPLHVAVDLGDEATVQVLLESGSVDPNRENRRGLTPLMLAVMEGKGVLAERLLEREDIKVICHDHTQTPLLWFAAINRIHSVVRSYLAAMGIDPDSTDTNDGRTVSSWATDFAKVDSWDMWTQMASASRGHAFLVRMLLEMENLYAQERYLTGEDWYTGDGLHQQSHQRPLLWAAAQNHPAVIEELQRKEISNPVYSQFLRIALFLAIRKGYGRVVQVLLRDCPDLEVVDLSGRILLILAVEEGHEKIVQYLLEGGAITTVKDLKHRTPLSLVIEKGYECIAQRLRNKGAGVEAE